MRACQANTATCNCDESDLEAHLVNNRQHGHAGLQQHAQRRGEGRVYVNRVQVPNFPPIPPLLTAVLHTPQ